jgi:hypothetical protein
MAIRKVKNPVEYCFLQWMNNYPDSTHWADRERFFQFVKAVARYRAKKWKNQEYLKEKILTILPSFAPELLKNRLELFNVLLDFQATRSSLENVFCDKEVKDDHYIEIRVKDGVMSENEVPLKKPIISS